MNKIFIILFLLYSIQLFGQDDKSPCEVTYTYNLNHINQITDFVNKPNGQKVVSWHWDFGDGTVSNSPNPRHIYMQAGSFIACLTIRTNDSCESTYCDTIFVGFLPADTSSLFTISGFVHAGPNYLPSGIALLISKNNTQYIVQNWTTIINGHYEFIHQSAGDYLVYAIPYFNLNINYFPSYLPSYSGGSTKWEDADVIHLSSDVYCNIDLECNNSILFGPDTISGTINILDQNNFEYNIYYASWFDTIGQINLDKAPNMPVLLLDNNDEPLRFVISDENGNFRFTNLPIRIYKLSPEKPGFSTVPETFNMETSTSNSASCSFFIETNSISIGISDPDYSLLLQNINVYPNPVTESAVISIVYEKERNIYISVEDITGKEVIKKEMFESYGSENYFVPFSGLKSGVYFIKIQSDQIPPVIKKIIKQ